MSKFLPFDEALTVAQSLGLANRVEWRAWCEEGMRPSNVPSSPDFTYKNGGWRGWGHWLGTGNQCTLARVFLPFAEALAVAQSRGLAGEGAWRVWRKEGLCPPNVPAHPDKIYKDKGWQGWGHWLGTGNLAGGAKEFLPFPDALAVARSLGLAGSRAWRVWCKEGRRPPNVPSMPNRTYKDHGWQGWVHWFGSSGITKAGKFAPFEQNLAFARSLELAGTAEWGAWCRNGMRPRNVPARPDVAYKDGGWRGWGHWLGTGNTKASTKQFLPFDEALAVARSLGLASQKQWGVWRKEGTCPPNVPSNPHRTYKDGGWRGWGHWLGTGNQSSKAKREQFLPFDQALRAARHLRLVSSTEWQLWCRSGARPANVPAAPDQVYVHDGWMGWEHFLCHANLGAATTPASTRPSAKRAASSCAGTASGKGGGKRRRR